MVSLILGLCFGVTGQILAKSAAPQRDRAAFALRARFRSLVRRAKPVAAAPQPTPGTTRKRLGRARLLLLCGVCWVAETFGLLFAVSFSARGIASFPATFAVLLVMPIGMAAAFALVRRLGPPPAYPATVLDVAMTSQIGVFLSWGYVMIAALLMVPVGHLMDSAASLLRSI